MAWDLKQPVMVDEEGNVSGGMWGGSPVGHAMDISRLEGILPGIADLAKFGIMGRGGVGDPDFSGLMRSIKGIARKMSNNPTQREDLAQTGFETILKRGESSTAKPTTMAKQGMIDSLRAEQPGGARSIDLTRLRQAQKNANQSLGREAGDADELMLAHKYRELLSKGELKDFSMDKFRRLRQTRPEQTVSMETPLTEKLNLGDTMAGGEDPSAIAAVAESIKKLTGAQAKNFQKLVDGLDVHPQEKARILDLLQSVRTPKGKN